MVPVAEPAVLPLYLSEAVTLALSIALPMKARSDGGRRPTVLGVILLILLVMVVLSEAKTSIEERLALCATCHGVDGNSTVAGIPTFHLI